MDEVIVRAAVRDDLAGLLALYRHLHPGDPAIAAQTAERVWETLIGSAFMWVYAFGAPLAGFIGDRVRRKDLILGGCLFWSAVTL